MTVIGGVGGAFWMQRSQAETLYPLDAAVNAFSCPAGLHRVALRRGIEDGFAPLADEPAAIRPLLLRNGFFADLADGQNLSAQLRNYDEGGTDRVLVDHFELRGQTASGALILRIASAGAGSSNDGVRLGDLDVLADPDKFDNGRGFQVSLADEGLRWKDLADGGRLVTIPFEKLTRNILPGSGSDTMAAYLARPDRSDVLDITVADDTRVDALALVACQRPDAARGVTLAEFRMKPFGEEYSWLGCSQDQSQRGCDPFGGDRLCSAPGPIACYHDGSVKAPAALTELGVVDTAFVGGEVRLSKPVRGDSFARLDDANRFCAASFGRGWRVLSYHEGGGGTVISRSKVAPRSRALVNIRDQQFANCWDRDIVR
jgi:hypothetical protein